MASGGIELAGHTKPIYACVASKDGTLLLSASGDETLRLWDLRDLCFIRSFVGHNCAVYSCAFSPDGLWALSGSLDGVIKLWQVSTGTQIFSLVEHKEAVMSICFSPIKFDPQAEAAHLPDQDSLETSPSLPPDSAVTWKYTAASASADKTIALWLLEICEQDHKNEELLQVPELGRLQSGEVFAGNARQARDDREQGKVGEFVVTVGKSASLVGHRHAVNGVIFSPDGQHIVSASADGTLKVWSTKTCLAVRTLTGHTDAVMAVDISSDSSLALSASQDHTLRLWVLSTGKQVKVLKGHRAAVRCCCFSGELSTQGAQRKGLLASHPIARIRCAVSGI